MKSIKALLILLLIPAMMYAGNGVKKSQTVNIKTSAACDECKGRIETAVSALDGVKKADVNLENKMLTVKYDPSKISVDQIRTAVSMSGYDADEVKADKDAYAKLPKCCQSGCMGHSGCSGEHHE